MSIFHIQSPSGRTITLEGDAPPSEQELDQIFASVESSKGIAQPEQMNVQVPTGTVSDALARNKALMTQQGVLGPELPQVEPKMRLTVDAYGNAVKVPDYGDLQPGVDQVYAAAKQASARENEQRIKEDLYKGFTGPVVQVLWPQGMRHEVERRYAQVVQNGQTGPQDVVVQPIARSIASLADMASPLALAQLGVAAIDPLTAPAIPAIGSLVARASFLKDMLMGLPQTVQKSQETLGQAAQAGGQDRGKNVEAATGLADVLANALFTAEVSKFAGQGLGIGRAEPKVGFVPKSAEDVGYEAARAEAAKQPPLMLPERSGAPIPLPPKPTISENLARVEQQLRSLPTPEVKEQPRQTTPVVTTPTVSSLAQELVPALRTKEGQVIEGQKGVTHNDVYNSLGPVEGNMLRLEQPEHGFVRGGEFLSREDASKLLGLKEPLHSERLQELQKGGDENATGIRENAQQVPTGGNVQEVRTSQSGTDLERGTQGRPDSGTRSTLTEEEKRQAQDALSEMQRSGKFYTGFPLLDPDFWKGVGFSENSKVDATQLRNRVRNKVGEKSTTWELLKDVLPESGKLSVSEAKQLIGEKGPKVEVHAYGMEGKVSEAKKEYDKMTHEWYEKLGGERQGWVDELIDDKNRNSALNFAKEHNWPKVDQEQLAKYYDLHNQVKAEPRDTSPRATQYYSTVSALPTDEPMPEWTAKKSGKNVQRVDVVIPQKQSQWQKAIDQEQEPMWRQDNLHENLPNTLGWAMIQYKTLHEPVEALKHGAIEVTLHNGEEGKVVEMGKERTDEPSQEQLLYTGKDGKVKTITWDDVESYADTNPKNRISGSERRTRMMRNLADGMPVSSEEIGVLGMERELINSGYKHMKGTDVWYPENKTQTIPAPDGWDTDISGLPKARKLYEPKKIAVITEAQSRWGQTIREERKGATTDAYQKVVDSKDHPLLRDYNRLILKAAIEQARKEGATHIAISDAETAMMTEGHDTVAGMIKPVATHDILDTNVGRNPGTREVISETRRKTFGDDWEQGRYVEWNNRVYRVDKPYKNPGHQAQDVAKELQKYEGKGSYVPQEPGMRLNYDTILPKIAEELTGSKGEKVSLGEHKNAYAHEGGTPRYERGEMVPRSNLIFRNPDGTPKTDITARMYPLDKLNEVNKPFTLTGKDTLSSRLESLKLKGGQGELHAFGIIPALGRTVWNAGLDVAQAAIREGKNLDDVIKDTIEHWKRTGKTFDEQLAEQSLREVFAPDSIVPKVMAQQQKSQEKIKSNSSAWRNWWMGREMRHRDIPALFDRVGNEAKGDARQPINSLAYDLALSSGQEVKSATGFRQKIPDIVQQAMSVVVEAKGQKANLNLFRDMLGDVKSKQAEQYRRAIDYAEHNWEGLQKMSPKTEASNSAQVSKENNLKVETDFREGYIPHIVDLTDENAVLFDRASGTSSGSFLKQREHDTFAEGIAAGVKYKTLNALDALEHRYAAGNRRAYANQLVEELKKVNDPATQQPIFKDLETRTKTLPTGPAGQQTGTPKGYEPMFFGTHPIAVHKGYARLFKSFNDLSWFDQSVIGRAAMQSVGLMKHTVLLFDTFHPIRLGLWSAPLKGLPTYKKGLMSLEFNNATIAKMVKDGVVDGKTAQEIKDRRNVNQIALRTGFNVNRIGDALHVDLLRKLNIAGTGAYNKWLFEKFQRGLMMEVYWQEFNRIKQQDVSRPDLEVGKEVSSALNTRFGNLGNQSYLRSKTLQDGLRLFFLAPQWNEGLVRSELGTLRDVMSMGNELRKGKLPRVPTLAKDVGVIIATYALVNQAINLATRGYPTWENKEDEPGAKWSAWIPDYVGGNKKGYFLNPWSLATEITHQILMQAEKKQSLRQGALDVMQFKFGPVGRSAWTLMTGEDWSGQKLPENEVMKEAGRELVPLPLQVPAIAGALRGREPYPGASQKQLLSSFGVKADIVKSEQQKAKVTRAQAIQRAQWAIRHVKTLPPEQRQAFIRETLQELDVKDRQRFAFALQRAARQ